MLKDKVREKFNKLIGHRYAGYFVELSDYAVSIFNFPGTLATCYVLCGIVGAAALGPVLATIIMIGLAVLGIYLARKYHFTAKTVDELDIDIANANSKKKALAAEKSNLDSKIQLVVKALIENETSEEKKAELKKKLAKLEEDAKTEYQAELDAKENGEKNFITVLMKQATDAFLKVESAYYETKKTKPHLINIFHVCLNIGLGAFSAFGLVGTLAFILGISSSVIMFSNPIGIAVFVTGFVVLTGLNLLFRFVFRDRLSRDFKAKESEHKQINKDNNALEHDIALKKLYLQKLEAPSKEQASQQQANAPSTTPLADSLQKHSEVTDVIPETLAAEATNTDSSELASSPRAEMTG